MFVYELAKSEKICNKLYEAHWGGGSRERGFHFAIYSIFTFFTMTICFYIF